MLFPYEFGVEIGLEGFFIHIADGEVGVGIHDDAVLVHLLNHREVNDVGAVDAHETVG